MKENKERENKDRMLLKKYVVAYEKLFLNTFAREHGWSVTI